MVPGTGFAVGYGTLACTPQCMCSALALPKVKIGESPSLSHVGNPYFFAFASFFSLGFFFGLGFFKKAEAAACQQLAVSAHPRRKPWETMKLNKRSL